MDEIAFFLLLRNIKIDGAMEISRHFCVHRHCRRKDVMDTYYSSETNVQILIALMKAHGVKKIVASPGATNICLVASLQQDPYFEMYSSVDERSAAYMACGLAAESGEAVALSCTGATASRNYFPGLTEAYYRKLPVLAITATQHTGRIGQNMPQVIDRSIQPKDTVRISVEAPIIHSEEDRWACELHVNQALIELRRDGGGPSHINLATSYSSDFSVKQLPEVKVVRRYTYGDSFPDIGRRKAAVLVGSHRIWDERLTGLVDAFCERYDAYVLCDHTSNYTGKYKIFPNLICYQEQYVSQLRYADLLIDMGNISGAYMNVDAKEVWRVSEDGEVRDGLKKATAVFAMREEDFFAYYNQVSEESAGISRYAAFRQEYDDMLAAVPELPFSNIWIAQHSARLVPDGCAMHFGILNTLRAWDFFTVDAQMAGYANTGGFGIDGNISSLIGASLAHPDKLYFGIFGDLSFFYDLNAMGNRHVGPNVRIMLVNNGKGTEFRNYNHSAARFGQEADLFMAAAGHYGNQSAELVKHYATDLGFVYLSADNKEQYLEKAAVFFDASSGRAPVIFEVFTCSDKESEALRMINNSRHNAVGNLKNAAKSVLGENGVRAVKKMLRR